MGGLFSKIGSDPYYANYEKSFQRLRKDIDRLSVSLGVRWRSGRACLQSKVFTKSMFMQAQTETRLQTRRRIGQFIVVWGTALFVVIALFAAWVSRSTGAYWFEFRW